MTDLERRHAAIEAIKKLHALKDCDDPERAHGEADDVLIEYLRAIEEPEIAGAWEVISPKWYA